MDYPVVRTARSPNLDTMPFDIVYEILSWLDYLDYINLGRVSRTLYSLLQNDLLAKRVIEVRNLRIVALSKRPTKQKKGNLVDDLSRLISCTPEKRNWPQKVACHFAMLLGGWSM